MSDAEQPLLKDSLTALILTYNEEENISRTLDSISWVPRVVVVDSYSNDGTVSMVSGRDNVSVKLRHFDNHPNQWNYALQQVRTCWVLALDADYRLPPSLQHELSSLKPPPDVRGYEAAFKYEMFGKLLRASLYPPRVVLFRRDGAEYVNDGHTQLLKMAPGRIQKLQYPIYHDDRKPLSRWIISQDRYAAIEAVNLLSASPNDLKFQDRLRQRVYLAPIVIFFYLLIYRGLVLDGWRGWCYVMQRVIAECLLSLRILTERYGLEKSGK